MADEWVKMVDPLEKWRYLDRRSGSMTEDALKRSVRGGHELVASVYGEVVVANQKD